MADDSLTLRRIDWREVFPFTNLFRAFRIAVHPSKLALGLLLLILLYCGGRVLDACWPRHSQAIWGEVEHYEGDLWGEPAAVDFQQPGAGYKFNQTLGSDFAIAADINPGAGPVSFDQWREGQAKAYRDQYAQLLQTSGLVPDAHAASDAADRGEYFDQLEAQIVARRNAQLHDIDSTYQKAVAAANTNQDYDAHESAKRDAARNRDAAMQQAERQCDAELHRLRTLVPHGLFIEFFDYEVRQVDSVVNGVLAWNWIGGFHPAGAIGPEGAVGETGVIHAVGNFLIVGPAWLLSKHWLFFTIMLVWYLLLWAIFGGAICRITAVHVARDEKISVRQALSFSFNKILSFIFAPVIPLLIVLFLGLLVGIGGLLFYIPFGIGPIVAGVFFCFALLAGGVMTVVSLGTIAGFNLMYPTVSVEGSDSFDAISRSFSYVFARPWRMLWYTFVTLIYGAFCFLFVRYFIFVLLGVTHFFVSWFLAGQAGRYFPEIWPGSSPANLTYAINFAELKWSESIASFLISIWVYLTIGLLGAYVISFYFSANTIIYYLMRREVDATELDDVYVEETDEDFADRSPTAPAPASSETPIAVVTETVVVVQPESPPSPPAPPSPAPPDSPPPAAGG